MLLLIIEIAENEILCFLLSIILKIYSHDQVKIPLSADELPYLWTYCSLCRLFSIDTAADLGQYTARSATSFFQCFDNHWFRLSVRLWIKTECIKYKVEWCLYASLSVRTDKAQNIAYHWTDYIVLFKEYPTGHANIPEQKNSPEQILYLRGYFQPFLWPKKARAKLIKYYVLFCYVICI